MKKLMTSIFACAMVIGFTACSTPEGPPPGGPGGFRGPDKPPSFDQLDADHDGKITLEEFKNFSPPKREPEDMFKLIDQNADGVLTPDEFENARPPHDRRR